MTDTPGRSPVVKASRTSFAFISWGAISGRSGEIAAALGGEAKCYYPAGNPKRPHVLIRYVLSAVRTVAFMISRRPEAVIVTNPPVFAGLVVYACSKLTGSTVGLDSHPGSFGAQEDRVSARLLPLHRWLVRRCGITLVTTEHWCDIVESWGGHPLIVHEAPGSWSPAQPPQPPESSERTRPRLFYVGRFAPDEPVEALIAAASAVPECDFYVTGRILDCPAALREHAPANVHFTGFLHSGAYQRALADADLVAALTTEPTSVMRAAYEATYAGKPLIISDWPAGRELFPHALHVENNAEDIARAVRSATGDRRSLLARAMPARETQLARWNAQEEALRAWIRDAGSRPARPTS